MLDYRSEKMVSLEGEGVARGRFASYLERAPDGFFDLVDEGLELIDHLPEEPRFSQVASAIELSELVSFWLSWHLAGGFAGLESAGWNRSTIFRKIRRFRAAFGEHPDSYRFPWLQVDWDKAWIGLFGALIQLAQVQRIQPDGVDPDILDDPPLSGHG